MRRIPIPAHLVPEGAELDGTGTAYMDAVALGFTGADPVPGQSELDVPRSNILFEADADEAKAMAAGGFRLWLRLAVTPVGVLVTLEPVDAPAPSRLPMNSDLEDP